MFKLVDGSHLARGKLRGFVDRVLDIEVKLHGLKTPEWNDLLNEARLSALAISLYLAGTVLGNPQPPAGVRTPLKLLVLDDVLIGLDLTNRLPILEIIEKRLPDFQVLLLTYDKVWFDISQLALTKPEQWVVCEMHSKPVRQKTFVFDSPVLRPQTEKLAEHFLALADDHLKNRHDDRTAALHTRTAFEIKLKAYCSHQKVFLRANQLLLPQHMMASFRQRPCPDSLIGIGFRRHAPNHPVPKLIELDTVQGPPCCRQSFHLSAHSCFPWHPVPFSPSRCWANSFKFHFFSNSSSNDHLPFQPESLPYKPDFCPVRHTESFIGTWPMQ